MTNATEGVEIVLPAEPMRKTSREELNSKPLATCFTGLLGNITLSWI